MLHGEHGRPMTTKEWIENFKLPPLPSPTHPASRRVQ
jgi:hypothetical protein